MPKMWRNCIEAGTKTFAQCPERYKADVLVLMRKDVEDGLMTKKGKMTPELFEELTGIPYEVETEEE